MKLRSAALSAANLALAPTLLASSCSLKPGDGADSVSLKFTIDRGFAARNAEPSFVNPESFIAPAQLNAMALDPYHPPSSASGFQCLAVNVVGQGIPAASVHNGDEDPSVVLPRMFAGESCAYPGITSAGIPIGSTTTVNLNVPSGPSRIVQIIGIDDPENRYCGAGSPIGEIDDSGSNRAEVRAYELGRTVIDLFKSTSVSVKNSYDTLSATDRQKRRVSCGNGGFTATSVAGLKLWLKADYFNTIPTVTDGASVPSGTQWIDESGNGYVLSPTLNGSSQRPVFLRTGGPGGTPAIQFSIASATGNGFETSTPTNFGGSALTGLTYFVVANNLGASNGTFLGIESANTSFGSGISGAYFHFIQDSGPYKFTVHEGVNDEGISSYSPVATNSYYIHYGIWDGSQVGGHAPAASSLIMTGTGAAQLSFITTTNIHVGGFLTSGADYLDGRISEVLVYNRSLSVSERDTVFRYLSDKYGLATHM